jgi:hypothetical protein
MTSSRGEEKKLRGSEDSICEMYVSTAATTVDKTATNIISANDDLVVIKGYRSSP